MRNRKPLHPVLVALGDALTLCLLGLFFYAMLLMAPGLEAMLIEAR